MREYEIELNGNKTTVQLSDEDAKARGLLGLKTEAKQAPAPKNKARTAQTKG